MLRKISITEIAPIHVEKLKTRSEVGAENEGEVMPKPIRVFYSDLSQRFYATRAYKEVKPGVVEVTGDKFDVTDDIARIVSIRNISFSPKES